MGRRSGLDADRRMRAVLALIDKDACVRHSAVNHDAVSMERRAEPDNKHHDDQREGAGHYAELAKRVVASHFILRFSPPKILFRFLFTNSP